MRCPNGRSSGRPFVVRGDAAVRVEQVVPEVAPTLKAFTDEAQRTAKTGEVAKLKQATANVRKGVSKYKWTVINYKASTDDGLANKRALLVAIRQYDIGFAAYATALDKVTDGASKASTVKSLRTFVKRLEEAIDDEAAALEAFGVDL